ncbi:aminopeptidase P N-terminal domain-containing protein [Acidobacteriota bacterium]
MIFRKFTHQLVLCLIILSLGFSVASGDLYGNQDAQRYTKRRQVLMDQIKEGIVLIQSSGGSEINPALYDKNLQYLTGLTSKRAVLLLAPKGVTVDRLETFLGPEVGRGRQVKEVLFVEMFTAREAALDGAGPSQSKLTEIVGVKTIYPLSRLNEIVLDNFKKQELVWFNKPAVYISEPLSSDLIWINKLKERYFWIGFRNVAPLIHEMRRVKEPSEVECLRKAFQIHTDIYVEIMSTLRPGMNEAEGEAIFESGLLKRANPNDIQGFVKEVSDSLDTMHAQIIVAAGKNSTIGHYVENNKVIKDGDLVLIDAGVSYKGYSSDITRTFPANGKFTSRQKELYAIVLEAQKKAIATMKPGSTARIAHNAVYKHFKEHGLEKFGYGTCGHAVGLNIHDANGDFDIPFEPGVVIVIEPFLAIPEEGIGIRIEDGVLITETGAELLPGPPQEISEVEALCQHK